jgi:hypothetical protein
MRSERLATSASSARRKQKGQKVLFAFFVILSISSSKFHCEKERRAGYLTPDSCFLIPEYRKIADDFHLFRSQETGIRSQLDPHRPTFPQFWNY